MFILIVTILPTVISLIRYYTPQVYSICEIKHNMTFPRRKH